LFLPLHLLFLLVIPEGNLRLSLLLLLGRSGLQPRHQATHNAGFSPWGMLSYNNAQSKSEDIKLSPYPT